VAVVLPARDAAGTLGAALESLRTQSYREFRLIAVDDGSVDGTREVMENAARDWGESPALSVVGLDRPKGITGALLAGIAQLRDEEFIARHDADDRSLPERLARQVAFLERNPQIGVVATGARTIRDPAFERTDGWKRYEEWLSGSSTPERIALDLWIESPLPHPTVMMRRSAYERSGGYRETAWPEDYDLWLRMLRCGIRMSRIPEELYEWTDSPGRASRILPQYSQESFLSCRIHHLIRFLRERREGWAPAEPVTVVVWGAGRDGRRAGRVLMWEGGEISAFLDIDPRKIGRTAYGRPIVAAEEYLQTHHGGGEDPVILAAVGTRGARDLIRARLRKAGLTEGPHFLCIA
jgi:cellulose synthase/poly-beta-1,6-N-acetylglucosamine synthase-like glycosyltransferase